MKYQRCHAIVSADTITKFALTTSISATTFPTSAAVSFTISLAATT